MQTLRRKHTLSSWIAILAILLSALMPAVSQAWERSRSDASATSQWLEVCSTDGTVWVRLESDGSLAEQTSQRPTDAPLSSSHAHCPYCVTHAASFALPPTEQPGSPVWQRRFEPSPPRALQIQTPLLWWVPGARAPPVNV